MPRSVGRGSEAALSFEPLSAAVLIAVVALLAEVARAERPAPPGHLTVAIAGADTDTFIDEWVSTPSSHAPVIRRVHEVGRLEATAHDRVNGTTATAVFPITLRKQRRAARRPSPRARPAPLSGTSS